MYINLLAIIVLSIISLIQDLKYRKIKNNTLLIFLFIGLLLFFYQYFIQKVDINISTLVINIIFVIVINFFLYYKKILHAGDGKLIIVFTLLFSIIFNDLFIFIYIPMIFLSFYLYAILKLITRFKLSLFKKVIKRLKLTDIFATFTVSFISTYLGLVFVFLKIENILLLFTTYIFFFLLVFDYTKKKLRLYPKFTISLLTILVIYKFILSPNLTDFLFAISYTIIWILFRRIINKLLEESAYTKIPINKLTEGMTLHSKLLKFKADHEILKKDIKLLKQNKIDYVLINTEIPFTIFIILGNIILLFYYLVIK